MSGGVKKEDGRVVSIVMESGKNYNGNYFIDASYEGDLMALAGVSYHVSRESRQTYNEPLTGVLGPTIK